MASPSLDDLYHMTARIFSEQNADRPLTTTFAHFVEVSGMLSIHDRKKRRGPYRNRCPLQSARLVLSAYG
jgi:hypothetical protein